MSKLLNSTQARAVQAFIDAGCAGFVLDWEQPSYVTVQGGDGIVCVRRRTDGGKETYPTYAAFTEAYTFLL